MMGVPCFLLRSYDMDYRRRLELIQDTRFPVACQRIKTSRDGRFLFATGTYPPQVKVYELSQLSMKFERHLDAQIVQFQVRPEHACTQTILVLGAKTNNNIGVERRF